MSLAMFAVYLVLTCFLEAVENQKTIRRLITPPNTLSESDKRELLDLHNEYRNMVANGDVSGQPRATNMNKLFWDRALENVAFNYLKNYCEGTPNGMAPHNPNLRNEFRDQVLKGVPEYNLDNTMTGENVAWSGSTNTNPINVLNTLKQSITGWFSEHNHYTFGSDISGAGHYTQIVWANTRFVGCAYYVSQSCGTQFICDYYPPGNFRTETPYEIPTSETISSCDINNGNCDNDRKICQGALCSGCMNKNYLVDNKQTSANLCTDGLSRTQLSFAPTPSPTSPPTLSPLTHLEKTRDICLTCKPNESCYNDRLGTYTPKDFDSNGLATRYEQIINDGGKWQVRRWSANVWFLNFIGQTNSFHAKCDKSDIKLCNFDAIEVNVNSCQKTPSPTTSPTTSSSTISSPTISSSTISSPTISPLTDIEEIRDICLTCKPNETCYNDRLGTYTPKDFDSNGLATRYEQIINDGGKFQVRRWSPNVWFLNFIGDTNTFHAKCDKSDVTLCNFGSISVDVNAC